MFLGKIQLNYWSVIINTILSLNEYKYIIQANSIATEWLKYQNKAITKLYDTTIETLRILSEELDITLFKGYVCNHSCTVKIEKNSPFLINIYTDFFGYATKRDLNKNLFTKNIDYNLLKIIYAGKNTRRVVPPAFTDEVCKEMKKLLNR